MFWYDAVFHVFAVLSEVNKATEFVIIPAKQPRILFVMALPKMKKLVTH